MNAEIRLEIVLHGIRWASNVLVELVGNHSGVLPDGARLALRRVTIDLQEAADAIRAAQAVREGE
jgi:hypothetical protein